MNFQEIAFGSEKFRQECELRNQILRVPLGLSLDELDLTNERDQMHFGLFDGESLLACVIAAPISATEVKLRQMAVAETVQRTGCGSAIIRCLEEQLLNRGFIHISLNARMSAVGFYRKLGYTCIGKEFIEVGIPHVKMQKHISSQAVGPSAQSAG